MQMRTTHSFLNQKQLDRREDDEQRSPERRPAKTIVVEPSTSPERYFGGHNNYETSSQQSHMGSHLNHSAMASSQHQPPQTYSQMTAISHDGSFNNNLIGSSQQQQQQQQHQQPQSGANSNFSPQRHHQKFNSNATTRYDNASQKKQQTSTTLSDLLQKQRKSDASASLLFPSKQVSAPQKTRKRQKSVLSQKEQFKLRPARCYMGAEPPQIHYSQGTLTWQQAIGCIADIGIDMSAHETGAPDQKQPIGYDIGETQFRQGARSDGFKNWSSKQKQQQPTAADRIQTDFYSRTVTDVAQPDHSQEVAKQSLTQNNFRSMHLRNDDENVSTDSVQEVKDDLLESLSYQKSPSGNQRGRNGKQNRSPNFKQLEGGEDRRPQNVIANRDAEGEAIQTLSNLRYSDLIYLLNIFKLQRSKNVESIQMGKVEHSIDETRERWVSDLQLALSVAISAEDRDKKNTNEIARVLIEKVESCNKPLSSESPQNHKEAYGLQYEHFIGPLVIFCAVDNLIRAQGKNNGDSECVSTIKLSFDQFERYYAKNASSSSQRRSNSMSGSTYPNQRADSMEVHPENFRNFVFMLKTFIDKENLPCKGNLLMALESIVFDKVQSNSLIFPQGSQLILSQLNRLFSDHQHEAVSTNQKQFDPLEMSSARNDRSPYHQRGSGLKFQDKCPNHGMTFCLCGNKNISTDNLMGGSIHRDGGTQKHAIAVTPDHNSKPHFMLQPQLGSGNDRATYYEQAIQGSARRQHSMMDFSASRRMKTQEIDYVSNQEALPEYKPFSTIMSTKDEGEVVRPSHYVSKNQPMSLELEHKRSVMTTSKSVQKPKKGILKNSSSYLDNSAKKQPVHFKSSTKQGNNIAHAFGSQGNLNLSSPFTALNKQKVGKAANGYSEKNPGQQLRSDSQKNLITRLGYPTQPYLTLPIKMTGRVGS